MAACGGSGARYQRMVSTLGSARLDKSKDTTMARRLAFGYALIASLWCAQAFALGLGDITIHSALNQKLDAEIELLETRGMTEAEIVAQLASSEDFKRVGIERFFFLTSLQFHVEMRDQGHAVLRVSSAQPMTEPYLNFLVQVIWPNGRLLKEYTVLLDPPTYKEQPAPAVASPGRSDKGGGPAGRVERTPTRPDSQVSLSSAPPSTQPTTQSQPPSDRLTGESYGVTDRDDTLWKIALRARPADVSVQQNMLAIQRLNPEAFIGGNINLLKAGYTLRLPKEVDVKAITSADAVTEVAAQNQAWQAYRRGEGLASVSPSTLPAAAEGQALAGQVDATTKKPAAAAPRGPDGELRIVAGDASDQGTGSGGGTADSAALESQLAAAKEEGDRIALERDEAVARLDKVTSQAEQTQRQIEVRDQQIAQMQEQLKAAKNAASAAPVAPKKETDSGIASVLASPFVMVGAAILLVLIVVAGLMRARGKRRAEDDQLTAFAEPVLAATASRARPRVEEIPEDDVEAEEPTLRQEEHEPPHHEGAQTSDVIGEADIYIAYGRYPQAVSLLLGALDDDPNRSDVRVKLLEVYAETKDEAGFETQMNELLTRCDDNELLLEARELETKLREDGPVASVSTADDDSAQGNLDDFQLDLNADEADDAEEDGGASATGTGAVSDHAGRASDDLGGDLGIDFKAGDEPTVVRTSSARAKQELGDVAVAADDGDDFDLEDLEFEPATRSESKSRPAGGEESDDAFEFLNEEDAATTKLDLARAYIDMGDEDGAREILTEVLQEGSSDQQQTANELLSKLG
jgi:pilus assembly protein FimV